MLRRVVQGVLLTLFIVVASAVATAPKALDHRPLLPAVEDDVEEWIRSRELSVDARTPIIDDADKRVRWHDPESRGRTRYAVVYLHGFSATRQEIAPVGERIAESLAANLFETRLTGHGLAEAPLAEATAEDWLDDGAEALGVGAAIGEQIVLIGTSTGATLALALADHPSFSAVTHLVLLSPNLAPKDGSAEVLTWPGGPQLARLLVGETRSWTPANDMQARFWSTTYPMHAAVEMMRLVEFARRKLPMTIEQSLLVVYSPNDQVIDPNRVVAAHAQITAPRSELVVIEESGDPSNHVLAGDILAPENNARVAALVASFVSAARL